jgi:hypothetical protein
VTDTASERLYRATLPQIPQFLVRIANNSHAMNMYSYSIQIALLKLLLTSTPTAKAKTESINILCDVIPEEMPCSMVQTMKLGFDINRHKVCYVNDIDSYETYEQCIIFRLGNDCQSCVSYSIASTQTFKSQSYLSSRHDICMLIVSLVYCHSSSNISVKILSFRIV